jgi:hypothetical protein
MSMDFDLDKAVTVLERTPAALRALLAGLDDGWLGGDEGPGTWSPLSVLGHLIHGDETDWMPRVRTILGPHPERPFVPFERDGHLRDAQPPVLDELLRRFTELRAANLQELRGFGITERELAMQGRHPEFGPVTLEQLLATWVVHDLGHLAQIGRTMAQQYRDATGPWQAYLPVLHRPSHS